MAFNNNGLQFDPTRGITNNNKQSVPTVASDYLVPSLISSLNTQWSPIQTKENQDYVKLYNSIHDDEKSAYFDPMREINAWKKGVSGLSKDTRKAWEDNNAEKIAGKDNEWKDRLWRNQEFVSIFGEDNFRQFNKDDRDKIYEDYLTEKAIRKKYKNNDNLQQLLSLTPEGREELLKANYKADWELKDADEKAEDKGWGDYSLKERWNSISSNAVTGAELGMTTGGVVGGVWSGGAGTLPGMGIGSLAGLVLGGIKGIISPQDAKEKNTALRHKSNDEILSSVTVADNKRKVAMSKPEIDKLYSGYLKAYQDGALTKDKIDEMFDNIALSGKKTYTDSFGKEHEYDYQGSSYYNAFKDTNEFEHFDVRDKLKQIAQAQVIGAKHGQGVAVQVLDQDMQTHVNENQTGWEWAGNSLKNIFVGGVANLANNVVGLGALAARTFYGEEGLANYLKGKDAADGTDNSKYLNPLYWSKVDQYNTLSKDAIEKAEKNGGVSPYNNIVAPGEDTDFWSWNTLNEAVRMNKFIWSDLIKNIGLGKLVRSAALAAGGKELAAGALATESTLASKVISRAGAFGVVNASSLGIDTAYGMQTYEEVLRQNNEKIDRIIDKDTEAEVQRRVSTPQAQAEFERLVAAENERRRKMAGPSTEVPSINVEAAWADYVSQIEQTVRQEQEALHAEDRAEAERSAADAYAIDASIEHLRMASTNLAFKSYLFDKGTINALRKNNPYVDTTTKDGMLAVSKNATRKKANQILAMNVWGGFQSNYFDDITVGFAKGFGIQDYNNYLLQKYNPAAYGTVMDDYVNPFVAGMLGAADASEEKRSLLDGTIGALGTVFTVMPNVVGMASHADHVKEFAEEAERTGQKDKKMSWQEAASDFLNNPILKAWADAKAATRATEAEIKRRNDKIKENSYTFDNMVPLISALNQKAAAREGMSVMEAEDAKDKEAFNVALALSDLRNSAAVVNAQAEPDRTTWSKKKKASALIGKGLNILLGRQLFNEADSSYSNAMRALNDAATIGETEEEETVARQEELINTFLGLDANKNVLNEMSEDEQRQFAIERLKKNANGMLSMIDKIDNLKEKFNKSESKFHVGMLNQLMYNHVLRERWDERGKELEAWITKEENPVQYNGEEAIMAKYGSLKGLEREKKSQEKRVEKAKEEYDDAVKIEKGLGWNNTLSVRANLELHGELKAKSIHAKEVLDIEKAKLNKIKQHEEQLKATSESGSNVIKAENILHLEANDRLRMLDDFYRNDYSEEQQKEIDRAKDLLMQDGTPITDAMEKVKDAAILKNRIDETTAASRRIMNNPKLANLMVQALQNNRRNNIVKYFNDKIVAEAVNDFVNDEESMLTEENATKKARQYSSAVLNGMLKEVNKKIKSGKEEQTALQLDNVKKGIETVLKERGERFKGTKDMRNYRAQNSRIKHTEIKPAVPIIDPSTNEVTGYQSAEQITTDRELSQNDKMLLEDAIDFAVERDIPVEELPDRVATEEFDNYIQERGHSMVVGGETGNEVHSIKTVENRVNPMPHDYTRGLLSDFIDSFKAHQEEVKKQNEAKKTSDAAKSVTTAPVDAKVKGADEKKNPAKKESDTLLDKVKSTKPAMVDDVDALLKELDKIDLEIRTREQIKKIILDAVTDDAITDIEGLKARLFNKSLSADKTIYPKINTALSRLALLNTAEEVEDNKEDAAKHNNDLDNNIFGDPASMPLELTTIDLGVMKKYPVFNSFIEKYKIESFVQKLSHFWNVGRSKNQKTGEQDTVHQAQAYFIYDPTLADDVEQSMKDDGKNYNSSTSAPILMVVEIDSKLEKLLKDEYEEWKEKRKEEQSSDFKTFLDEKAKNGELYKINYNGWKYFQPIGIMPGNQSMDIDSDLIKNSRFRMKEIRDRIESSLVVNKKTGKASPSLIRLNKNGTPIKGNISSIDPNISDVETPSSAEDVPAKSVITLSEENLKGEFPLKETDDIDKRKYDAAKDRYEASRSKENWKLLKGSDFYKAMRKTFLSRLRKARIIAKDKLHKDRNALQFLIQKGTRDMYPKEVRTKPISKTIDNNTGRTIIDILKNAGNEKDGVQVLFDSSFLIKNLYDELSKLKYNTSLFNSKGNIVDQNAYDSFIESLRKDVKNAINNHLYVKNLDVAIEISDGNVNEKTITFKVYSGDELLAELKHGYANVFGRNKIAGTDYADFVRDIILDEKGNVRMDPLNPSAELVGWQVNYGDLLILNPDNHTAEEVKKLGEVSEAQKTKVRERWDRMFDDNIFEMHVTKLSYPSGSISMGNVGGNLSKLFGKDRNDNSNAQNPTGSKPASTVVTDSGLVDADTGAIITPAEKEEFFDGLDQDIKDKIDHMKEVQEGRKLTEEEDGYNIEGKFWARVTSVKYTLARMKDRFKETLSRIPALAIGNGFDEFGRDFANGIFDRLSKEERLEAFSAYKCSTADNFDEVFLALKAFETRLKTQKNQYIIAIGDAANPGNITVKGTLKVSKNINDKELITNSIRVAGSVDLITVDKEGKIHIYDFKTHHGSVEELNVDVAEKEGYDRQLSMYAQFLENEFGLEVGSVNIIPVGVSYTSPKQEGDYRVENGILEKRTSKGEYVEFTQANYKVGKEFELTKLTGDDLVASFEKMTKEELKAIDQADQDQNDTPRAETGNGEVKVAPDGVTYESEEEDLGFKVGPVSNQLNSRLDKYLPKKSETTGNPQVNTEDAINPEESVQKAEDDHNAACAKKGTK